MLFQIYVHFFLVLLLAQFCVCLDGNDSMSIFEKKWFAEESRECNKGEFEVSSIVMGCEKKRRHKEERRIITLKVRKYDLCKMT